MLLSYFFMMSDNLPKNEQFLSTNRFLGRNHADALNDRINFNFELYNVQSYKGVQWFSFNQ